MCGIGRGDGGPGGPRSKSSKAGPVASKASTAIKADQHPYDREVGNFALEKRRKILRLEEMRNGKKYTEIHC